MDLIGDPEQMSFDVLSEGGIVKGITFELHPVQDFLGRRVGIEPTTSPPQGDVLPLNYTLH
jgi:hypothetical protein